MWAYFEGRIILAVKQGPKTSRDSNFSFTLGSVPRQVCLLMHLSYTLINVSIVSIVSTVNIIIVVSTV